MSGKNSKVDVLLIGAARSGTTSLSKVLASHPDISFSNPKEPQFFSKPDWRDHLEEYHSLFAENKKLWMEGSTNYSKFPAFNTNIHKDIFEYNPGIKILYMLRHPVERLISHYRFAVERGLTEDSLETAIQLNPIYINTSKYFSQIQPYIDYFGKENVQLVFMEDFQDNPRKTLLRIWNFLEIDGLENLPTHLHLNQSGKGQIGHIKFDKPDGVKGRIGKILHALERWLGLRRPKFILNMDSHLKKRLFTEFDGEISSIEKLSGRDLSNWREF